jgi:hypothetical protein
MSDRLFFPLVILAAAAMIFLSLSAPAPGAL